MDINRYICTNKMEFDKPTYSRSREIDIIHKMRGLGKL